MKKFLLTFLALIWIIPHSIPVYADDLKSGEYAITTDGSPAMSGQCVMDHLFARNEYIDANGQHFVVDNAVSFKDNDTQLVWLWLDDDQIYMNEAVQALTPIAYNSAGDLYNEITYNSCQFELYLPSSVSLTKTVTNKTAIWGDRLPSTSGVYWAKKSSSLTIDGITYDSYQVLVYNTNYYGYYGSHFSGKDATMYEQQGALKKDDAPLLGLSLQCNNSSIGELPDMIIANILFVIQEATAAFHEPNEYKFYYGTGGNNMQQRFQLYNRVKLTEGDLEPVAYFTPAPEITASVTDNSVVVTATGEGDVKLYIDGVAVSNPYTISRGAEDKSYTATATAQADGMGVSETTTQTIVVPAMQSDGSYLYISDYQVPESKLGGEIALPIKAHFDGRLNSWYVEFSFPDGLTPVAYETGGGMTVSYMDARGNQKTLTAPLSVGPDRTNVLSAISTDGYYIPEGSTEYATYGAVKWEAGDYDDMIVLYCDVDPDFAGGQLEVVTFPNSGKDTRGGTTAPGQEHHFLTNITVGGVELTGEIVIGDCDANGKVPVSYTGSEDVTLEVMVDGQSVPVVDGMVQLNHYGTTIVTAEASAIGYVPLREIAEVNWTAIISGDWEILKAFYNQYKNDQFVWDMSDRNKPGSCPGVGVENGRVVSIEVPGLALEGEFPTMLLSLAKLRVLDLSHNNLSGDAAVAVTQYLAAHNGLTIALQVLNIEDNRFEGNLGVLAAPMTALTTLDASENRFNAVYPMINAGVELDLNNQTIDMVIDLTGGVMGLASAIPNICLYNHADQQFDTNFNLTLANNAQSPAWTLTAWMQDGDYGYYAPVPYRGENGQVLDGATALTGSWPNNQQLLATFNFAMGDANLNGPVDITDLQAMVKYIFGEYSNRPFNYTAANLNSDNTINVQDVVGEANLLLSMELTMPAAGSLRAPVRDGAAADAYLYWEDGTLYLNTAVAVTALDIVNEVGGDISWNVANLGFVVKSMDGEQGNHAVIYSLDDAAFQPGVTAIATTGDRMATVVAAKLSDADAELIPVRLNDKTTGLSTLNEDGKAQCHVQGGDLVITSGTALSDVAIAIYAIDGKLLASRHLGSLDSGRTAVSLRDMVTSDGYCLIVVRSGKQIIATQKLTQIR